MKISFRIALLVSVIFMTSYNSAQAQYTPVEKKKTTSKSKSKSNDKYFDESGDFAQHLQYAIHFSPSLSFSSNYFYLRLDPSAGYKFNKYLMAGVTVGTEYNYQRFGNSSGGLSSVNLWNFRYGVYGRAKFFDQFYAVTEYKLASYSDAFYDNNNNIVTQRQTKPELNLGIAYKTAPTNGWGFELGLTINVLYDEATYFSTANKFDFRAGATYNF